MVALADAQKKQSIPTWEIAVVISSNPRAEGLKKASDMGLKTVAIQHSDFDSKQAYERAILDELRASGVTLVLLAGYMKLLGPTLLSEYQTSIMNIHPSLLPAFKGLNAQKQALEYGVKTSGCTVHFVDESLDGGPIILQEAVPVLAGDTESCLSERILVKEHHSYPKAVQLYAEGRLQVKNRVVEILGQNDETKQGVIR